MKKLHVIPTLSPNGWLQELFGGRSSFATSASHRVKACCLYMLYEVSAAAQGGGIFL